jgi:hypothetical protein
MRYKGKNYLKLMHVDRDKLSKSMSPVESWTMATNTLSFNSSVDTVLFNYNVVQLNYHNVVQLKLMLFNKPSNILRSSSNCSVTDHKQEHNMGHGLIN